MQNPLRHGTILLLASTFLTSSIPSAAAQPEQGEQADRESARAVRSPYANAPSPLIDLDFAGGTLEEFIVVLREAAETPVNVMIPDPAVLKHPVPALNFRHVSLANVLKALEWTTGPDNQARIVVTDRGEELGEPIYGIHRVQAPSFPRAMPVGVPVSPPSVRVFMIRDLIEAPQGAGVDGTTVLSSESLLAAVDAVLASVPEGAERPTVRYHPESATLIVTAPEQQLHAVNQMLLSVQEDIHHRRRSAVAANERIADAEMRLRRTSVEIDAIQQQIARTKETLRHRQEQAELLRHRLEFDATPLDVAAAEEQVASTQAQISALQSQLQLKEIEQEVARSDLDAARQGMAQLPAAAEAHAANYHDPIVLRARPETMAIIDAVRKATPSGGLPTINANTDQGLTITATEPQHAILRAAIQAMNAAAGTPSSPPPDRQQRNNRRE